MAMQLAQKVDLDGWHLYVHGDHSLEKGALVRIGAGTANDEQCWVEKTTRLPLHTLIALAHGTHHEHALGEVVNVSSAPRATASATLLDAVNPGDDVVRVGGVPRYGLGLLRMGAETITADETHRGLAAPSTDGSHIVIKLATAAKHAHARGEPVFFLPQALARFYGAPTTVRRSDDVQHLDPNRRNRYVKASRRRVQAPAVLARLYANDAGMTLSKALRAGSYPERLATGQRGSTYTYSGHGYSQKTSQRHTPQPVVPRGRIADGRRRTRAVASPAPRTARVPNRSRSHASQ